MCRSWILRSMIALSLAFQAGCKTAPKPVVLPPGQIPLKVMTLDFGQSPGYTHGYLVAPMNGDPFVPPTKPKHSTAVVAFNPKQPVPIPMQVRWTIYDSAFKPSSFEGYQRSSQMEIGEWEHTSNLQIAGPLPENPEHLLLIFYPEGKMKAEILSQAQVDAGRMEAIIREFKATWPGLHRPEETTKKDAKRP